MSQGRNPARGQHKTIKERLSNLTSAFQSDRKRRKPSPSVASPTTAADAASFSGGGNQDRNRRALKSLVLPYFVPTHTPDRPSRPVTDAPSEEECYALLSGRQRVATEVNTLSISYPTRRDSVGSSGQGSGVLVVHLDSDGPPAYEQPRPAPRPPPSSGERRQQQQRQFYRSSPSPMRQNSTASSSRSASPYQRHRDKELPPLRIGDETAVRKREDQPRSGGDTVNRGDDGGQQMRGVFIPSPHTAPTTCRLCYRACGQQADTAVLCRDCELASATSGSVSSGSHYGDENAAEQQPLKNRPRDLGVGGSDCYSSRVGSVSVEVLGSPASASARSDFDTDANRNPHHTFDFGFSTAAAEDQDNAGKAAATTTTRRHRLVVVKQKPVIVDDGDGALLDWDTEWNPAYYFGGGTEKSGADGSGTGSDRLSSAVQRQIEADNARGSGGSNDSISPEPTPTSPILSRLPRGEDVMMRAAGEGVVVKRREEPSSFI
ncbi:hypothetical protein MAPG_03980 [Magnaporthiopsis poae ATCC 64411]|uniref:Uncharacterized protein n=1 Tax=Magnaporthiopsis poae (strain ATCC 64411 / 73-15) TaxID=644358 RepID=A0A0C4DVH6_MAGP6|nr:hypothetical protein MAPG_03980 [Magnaporthiopsis poae ATCC 64411]